MRPIAHFKTITEHKKLVMQYCFRAGLYYQGIMHDMSKYSPTEFWVGAKYYQGYRSPNNAEREDRGYSAAWLHHKGRNKHHLEYWIDYSIEADGKMAGMKMPEKYVVEMFCDRVAASRIYLKDQYHDGASWEYFDRSRDHYIIHPDTAKLLEKLLLMLKEEGEDATFSYIRSKRCGWKTGFRRKHVKKKREATNNCAVSKKDSAKIR
ncbi:MAG: DUF5662 family protein [Lachnospiraceae bacterium]